VVTARDVIGTCIAAKHAPNLSAEGGVPLNVLEGHILVHSITSKGKSKQAQFDDESLLDEEGNELATMSEAVATGAPVYIWWNFLRLQSKSR
jgi:hypothetical protein